MTLIIALLTTATVWAQDAISGLTYNSTGGYYEIPNEAALNALRTYVNGGNNASGKTFKQTADITLTQNFTPIGYRNSSSDHKKFCGTYDGNGKTISGLTIAGGSTTFQALFGSVENATIQNLTLSGASISGGTYAGAFVGYSWNGLTMTNCHAVNCTVSSTGNYVGIFVGYLTGSASTIKSCSATGGSVSGSSEVGAIVGYSYASKANTHKIVGCVGRVTGGANVVGENSRTSSQIIVSYGVNAYTITAGTGVTITYNSVSSTYSDIVHPPYIVAGETVSVTLGYTGSLSSYTFQATGATLNNEGTQLSNAQGNVEITATEVQKTDISGGSIADIAVQTWTGSAITPAPVVTVGGKTLTATTDYLVNYTNNTHLGTATVTVTGTGAYEGTLSKTFEIRHADMPYNSTDGCYEIGNETALRALSTYVNSGGATTSKTFKQTADITLTSAFSPIGYSSERKFQGTYDGDNKTISGLSVSGNVQYAALFGYMVGATVKNVVLISPNVSSSAKDSGVSALVGYMNVGSNNSIIDNCIVINPSLSATGGGTNYVGVLCAHIQQSNITNCHYYDSNAEHSYPIAGYYNPSYSTVANSERVYAITATGCTFTATPTISVSGTDYYTSGSAVTLSHAEPAAGYLFGAYASSDVNITDGTFTMPTTDVSVTATFTPINYTIAYTLDDGSVAIENPSSYTIESEAITLNNPTKDGYTFTGWTGTGLDAATETVTIAQGSTGNRAYTATWTASETIALTANQAPDENYWTTFYCGDAAYTIDDGENACAYTATYADGKLTLHNQGKEIPQGTAVIIVADNNEVSMTETDLAAFSGDNDLRGVDVDTPTADIQSTLGSGTFYVLGMTVVGGEQHFGFHRYEGATMAARKAFVLINGSNAALARSLTMVFEGEATGIKTTDFTDYTDSDDAWYTLDGRRLQGKPAKSGIYVNNGRKVAIK